SIHSPRRRATNTGGMPWPRVRCAATRRRRSRRPSGTRRRRAAPASRRSPWRGSQSSPGRTRSGRRTSRAQRAHRYSAAIILAAPERWVYVFHVGRLAIVGLLAPLRPSLARPAREQLEMGRRVARLDELILLLRLARVCALARRKQIRLPASWRQRARVLAPHAEQHELGAIAEIKPDPAPVRPAVLAHLVPHNI